MNLDALSSEFFLKLKVKAEPAEGGAVASLFIPAELKPLIPGLMFAATAQMGSDKDLNKALVVFAKQLMNAMDGLHSDGEGNAEP